MYNIGSFVFNFRIYTMATIQNNKHGLNYKSAGVDIDAGNALVEKIKPLAAKTRRDGVMAGLGGFGSLFELPLDRYQNPLLVSGTDGVGTKLKLALETGKHDTVGIDLVAMCVNDIVVLGAEPLFFLDYYATGKLDVDTAESVISGIAQGCQLSGAALVGGETAEMPGMYAEGDYDLAGFSVGIVEKETVIDGSTVAVGDKLIGLASSGPHSNGYSLIRKIISQNNVDLESKLGSDRLVDLLMQPTRIYVKTVLALLDSVPVHAIAHITGGGITENLPRVLKEGLQANIHLNRWEQPSIFKWLQEQGNVSAEDMLLTFNCGVGMVITVPAEHEQTVLKKLAELGEIAFVLGEIVEGSGEPKVVYK